LGPNPNVKPLKVITEYVIQTSQNPCQKKFLMLLKFINRQNKKTLKTSAILSFPWLCEKYLRIVC